MIRMTLSIPTVVRNEVRNLPLEWQEWRKHQCLVVFGEPLALVFLQYLVQRLPRKFQDCSYHIYIYVYFKERYKKNVLY